MLSLTEVTVDRMSRILLAIDQPEFGRAEARAALLARQLGVTSFDVVATKGAGIGRRTAFSHLRVDDHALFAMVDGRRRLLEETLQPAWTVRDGSSAHIVAEAADDLGADLVVLPGCSGSAMAGWLRPPRGVEVARMCRSPVLMVNAAPRDEYRRILIALDFSRASLGAARAALRMAPSASFTFLHAFRLQDETLMRELELPARVIGAYREQGWEKARTKLNEYVDLFFPTVEERSRVVHYGSAHGAILHHARRWGADLIVIGKERGRYCRRFAAGSIAQRLIRHAGCDLLTGPGPLGRDNDERLAA